MRVCDRHLDRRAVDSVLLHNDDARYDLCAHCKTELIQFLSTPVEDVPHETKRRGRPPKDTAQAA